MKPILLLIPCAFAATISSNAYAACTLKTAQEKMMAVNNMAQVYNRKIFDYMEKGQDAPTSLLNKQSAINDATNAIGLRLAAVSEENPSLGYEDKIDTSICDQYDSVLAEHAPDGYQGAVINRQDTTDDPNCNSTVLWERFGVAVQKQVELSKAGKIDDTEAAQYMRLTSSIGEYATTDLKKACDAQTDFEEKLASE